MSITFTSIQTSQDDVSHTNVMNVERNLSKRNKKIIKKRNIAKKIMDRGMNMSQHLSTLISLKENKIGLI